MIPTAFRTGRGVDLLFHIIINMYEGVDFLDREGNINPEVAKDLQNWHKRYEKSNDTDHLEDFAHGTRPRRNIFRHIHVNHGKYIEQAIDDIR